MNRSEKDCADRERCTAHGAALCNRSRQAWSISAKPVPALPTNSPRTSTLAVAPASRRRFPATAGRIAGETPAPRGKSLNRRAVGDDRQRQRQLPGKAEAFTLGDRIVKRLVYGGAARGL